MKIALLSEKYTPDIGGLAISTGRLGQLLSTAGHDVRVFAPTSNLPPSERRTLIHEGVSVTRFGVRKRVDDTLVDWLDRIVEEHKHEPFDVLHAYFLPQAGFVAAYAGKYLDIPSVVSIRGNDIERAAFDPSKFSHVMYALQNASAVTTNASELAKKAKAFFDREVILIPNGIDTENFKPMEKNFAMADALGLISSADESERNQLVIGFVGELREKKGLTTILGGYAQIKKEHPTSLLIVGEIRAGEDKQIFDEFLRSNPDSRIVTTGYIAQTDLPAYYSLIDIFVHPSLRDGLPNALLEAMACEKPVIATPVGGILDIVRDGENGMFVPVNDVNALADSINLLFREESLRKKFGRSARRTIFEKFTREKELEANLKVYKKLGIGS